VGRQGVIVIDVGCARYGGDYSIERLIEEFSPDTVIGYDPNPAALDTRVEGDTPVTIYNMAAWTYDGTVGFVENGLRSHVRMGFGTPVQCVDLARVILELPEGEEIVLKMDAEGAEYVLLPHLYSQRADERLRLAWVEWHDPQGGRETLEGMLRCEVTEWRW
jgi:FkbM family methyltransferase